MGAIQGEIEVIWDNWATGSKTWNFGPLVPDEVLYEYMGPSMFTTTVGLQHILVYKSFEHSDGDYFIAVETSVEIIDALKAGRLSVRGALSQSTCWLMDLNLDLNVQRYEQVSLGAISDLIPETGIPLYADMKLAADSLQQATSPLSFKFYGNELLDGLMPLDIFKTLVNSTYDFVRRLFVPPALIASKAGDLLAFPMRQPLLGSLIISIDHPEIDAERMRRRFSTKNLDAKELEQQAEKEGAKFVEGIEKTVERAASGRGMKTFARDNFMLLDNLADIVPGERGDVSRLQLSSYLAGQDIFVELDREIGERIKHAYRTVRDDVVDVRGIVAGTIDKSNLLILRPDRGREITCYIAPDIFNDLLVRGELNSGRRLMLSGSFQKRVRRNLMQVEDVKLL
jgi:hypothetical protein